MLLADDHIVKELSLHTLHGIALSSQLLFLDLDTIRVLDMKQTGCWFFGALTHCVRLVFRMALQLGLAL